MRHPEGIVRKASGGFVYYYAKKDHIGSTRVLCYPNGTKLTPAQRTDYYLFGLSFFSASTNYNRYLFSGKELQDQTVNGKKLEWYDFGARNYDPILGRWLNPDPVLQSTNPYIYCANNPIRFIDPDGKAWRPTYSTTSHGYERPVGYTWVPKDESYGPDGVLMEGLFEQAIFFSHNGNYDPKEKYNIGSSTATVYAADRNIYTFDAMTYPSDLNIFATIPEGTYEVTTGIHYGSITSYPALKVRDIGTRNQTINLGMKNPAYKDGRRYAENINIHKAGKNNYTGTINYGKNGISQGCLLIDRNE